MLLSFFWTKRTEITSIGRFSVFPKKELIGSVLGLGILQFTDDEEFFRKSKNRFLTSNHGSENSKEPVKEPTLNCWYLFHNTLGSLNFFFSKTCNQRFFWLWIKEKKKPRTADSFFDSKKIQRNKAPKWRFFWFWKFSKTQNKPCNKIKELSNT